MSTVKAQEQTWLPAMDVLETPSELVITMGVEGANPEDLQVELADGTIVVRGTTPRGYRRTVRLVDPVTLEDMEASVDDERVVVRIPKAFTN